MQTDILFCMSIGILLAKHRGLQTEVIDCKSTNISNNNRKMEKKQYFTYRISTVCHGDDSSFQRELLQSVVLASSKHLTFENPF